MPEADLLQALAPCGLCCLTCTGSRHGTIQAHCAALVHLLEGFDHYAEMFADFQPALRKYPEFKEVLTALAAASCTGCRNGEPAFPGCTIAPCVKARGLRFCAECEDFPCEKMATDMPIAAKWRRCSQRIKEIGPEAYLAEVRDKSHYV